MKKSIITLILALIVSVSIAQTPGTSSKITFNAAGDTITTITTITIKPYKAPTYRNVGPLVLQSGSIYRYLIIDLKGANVAGMVANNLNKVRITHCKIINSATDGIQLNNCSNITIDSCFISNVKAGINVKYSTTIKVNYNQFLNMNGPYPSGNFVQFNNVNAGGNQINYNRCENIAGQAKHPQDGLSVFQSNGLPGDSIQVIGNWIRGGQVQNDSGGAAAIVLGDVGGSYQVGRYNIIVNGGYVGAQVQGGSHIKFDHNTIYGAITPYSNCGLCFGNYSKLPSSDIFMGYNNIKYFQTSGKEMDLWWDPKTAFKPNGWDTNIQRANISTNALTPIIITMK